MRKILKICLYSVVLVLFACNNDDDNQQPAGLIATYQVALTTANSIPVVNGRMETGSAVLKLFADRKLTFEITVNNLIPTDALTMAHVHLGDAVSTGDVLITLVDGQDIAFSQGMASGSMVLTEAQAMALQGQNLYINVHSTDTPPGLVRGQIGQEITDAYNVVLLPENEIPAIEGRNETGLAYIRLVGDMMYYRITIENLLETDMITAGHIHDGTAQQTGTPIFLNLDIAPLGTTKMLHLTGQELNKVQTEPLYVNIHSDDHGLGLMRGQIR